MGELFSIHLPDNSYTIHHKKVHGTKIFKGQKLMVYVKQPKSIFIKDLVNGTELEDDKPLLSDQEKKDIDKAADKVDEPTQ